MASDDKTASRAIITMVVMAAAVLQVLDTTIVTVAMPHMQGSLSATPDQISWVLTSYLISSGIFMPLTGYFTDRLGQKRYLILCIVGFVTASALCGIATSLPEMVLFRLLQGVAGAGLVPLAQAILVKAYPPEERGKAMAIFGVGVMVGPILGPTLGGYLTQMLSWRWTFYINVPVGILALVGALIFVPDSDTKPRRMDWLGFVFLLMGVGGLQFVLDRGTSEDWFSSGVIRVTALMSVIGFIGMIARSLSLGERALLDLSLFKDRNFTTSCLIFSALFFSMYGALTLQPMMIETLLGYPTLTAGLVMAPRGIAAMVAMFTVGRLFNRFGPRPFILIGVILIGVGTLVTKEYTLQVSTWGLIWPIILQGFGTGMAFVPLATMAFATLAPERASEAAGMRQLVRSLAASVGVATGTALMTRQGQVLWQQIGEHINPFNPALYAYLHNLHLDPHQPLAGAVLGHLLSRQSQFLAMLDVFVVLGWGAFATLPLLLLMKWKRKKKDEAENPE